MSILKIQQQNVAAAAAYTEYTLVVPGARVNELTFALRDKTAKLFWYMATTDGNTPGSSSNLPSVYETVIAGEKRNIRGAVGAQTIYFQSDKATQVLEASYYADK